MDEDEEVSWNSASDNGGFDADLDDCASSDLSDGDLDSLENDQDRVDRERDRGRSEQGHRGFTTPPRKRKLRNTSFR